MKASPEKRMRIIRRIISKVVGSKRERYEQKLSYVGTLPSYVRFESGEKILGEGGYR